jgi:hypothetical protein
MIALDLFSRRHCDQFRRRAVRQNPVYAFLIGFAMLLCAVQALASKSSLSGCGAQISPQMLESSHTVCDDPSANVQVRAALRLVCFQGRKERRLSSGKRVIVIGFLGGFVHHDDPKHPEVWFAKYLSEHYSSLPIFVDVFSNHEERAAMRDVLTLLDTDCDGALSDSEKKQARIIIYGHSWGASETAAFARDLGELGIPVLLTAQIDIIPKPHQKSIEIPSNVEHAINFYQSRGGILHGASRIVADDTAQTEIGGNVALNYRNDPIDCGNFPWLARTFNKSHHEIENDPLVWNRIALLIDASLRRPVTENRTVLAALSF